MSDEWPVWARQPVEIVDPDPRWQRLGRDLATRLTRRLSPWLAGRVEHVGSTAVPGLAAKPVIDLLAPVTSLVEDVRLEATLAELGYELVPPELDARPWRRLYVLPDGERRHAHLHLVARDHPRWRRTLVFRDRLREHPEMAAEYARVKREAAAAHEHDREAYTAAKTDFVERVLTWPPPAPHEGPHG